MFLALKTVANKVNAVFKKKCLFMKMEPFKTDLRKDNSFIYGIPK